MYSEVWIANMSLIDFITDVRNRRDLIQGIDDLDYLKMSIYFVHTNSFSSWAKQFSLIDKNILLLAPVFTSCSSFFFFCLLKHFIHENQVLINDIFKK